ncbi:MAG: amidohydrolase family protein [bacterium]|nr:amidohydrolase family protein [bacterium]
MGARADAHIHLFEGGYQGGFVARPGVEMDEAACYASLAKDHGVEAVLVVGYSGAPWCADNGDYLARMAAEYDWVRPVRSADAEQPPTVAELEVFREQGFVGLSFYVFGEEATAALRAVPDDLWAWMEEHRWLVSVNSKGEDWVAWGDVLGRHEGLRVVVSHLGLPPPASASTPASVEELSHVLALARFSGVQVKLSGFYALTEPRYDYPHRAAWPYVEALIEAYGVGRLLWASDFTPCLDFLSFPQTFGLFSHMPFLSADDRAQIEGANLLGLLDEVC